MGTLYYLRNFPTSIKLLKIEFILNDYNIYILINLKLIVNPILANINVMFLWKFSGRIFF